MRKYALLILVVLLSSMVSAVEVEKLPKYQPDKVNIWFFYNPLCSHCQAEEKFFENLNKTNIVIHKTNIQKEPSLAKAFAQVYHIDTTDVPLTFIGQDAFIGFTYKRGTPIKFKNATIGFSNVILDSINKQLRKHNFSEISYQKPKKKSDWKISYTLGIICLIIGVISIYFVAIYPKKTKNKENKEDYRRQN